MACFQDLPPELCLRVLCCLPALVVVRLQQVSSSLRKLIRNSLELQYKIECFLEGAVDEAPESQHSTRDKMEKLKLWRQMWKRPSWSEERRLPPIHSHPCVSGPVFAHGTSEHSPHTAIEFHALEGRLRNVKPKSWTLDGLREYEVFKFDWYQDLLVIVENSIGSDEVTLRFLSCTTGGPHPAARHTNLRTMLPKARVRTNEELFELRVCGDIIAARYEYSDGLIFGLWVFDWRRGSLLLHLGVGRSNTLEHEENMPHHFAFLDSRHLLISTYGSSHLQVLVVFDCYGVSSAQRLLFLDAMRHHASLVLELPHRSILWSDHLFFSLDCQPDSPFALPAQIEGVTFRAAGPPVVLVGMENGDQPPIQCDIFIPGQFILSQLTRARARRASTSSVPWIAWQDYSRECRLFNTLRRCSGSVYGARYAFEGKVRQSTETAQSSLDGRLILIRHFGEPAAILRDTDVDSFTEDNEGGGAVKPRVYAVLEPSDELNRDIWTKPMWTGAPYL